MSMRLLQGAAVRMATSSGDPVRRLLIGATWTKIDVDVDMSALLLRPEGTSFTVADANSFLFRSRRTTPERSAFLTYLPVGQVAGPDRAQIILDFGAMPANVSRIVIAMSALQTGETLAGMGTLRTRAMDVATGETMYVYQHQSAQTLAGQCVQLWTLWREAGCWEGRVNAAVYPGGAPALVRDFGVRPR